VATKEHIRAQILFIVTMFSFGIFLSAFYIFPKKFLTTFHGYEGNKIPNVKAKIMHKLAEKLSKGNICVGDFLQKWYGTKPTFVTYGAIDKKDINTKSKDVKKNSVIFLGRLEEETGIFKIPRGAGNSRQSRH